MGLSLWDRGGKWWAKGSVVRKVDGQRSGRIRKSLGLSVGAPMRLVKEALAKLEADEVNAQPEAEAGLPSTMAGVIDCYLRSRPMAVDAHVGKLRQARRWIGDVKPHDLTGKKVDAWVCHASRVKELTSATKATRVAAMKAVWHWAGREWEDARLPQLNWVSHSAQYVVQPKYLAPAERRALLEKLTPWPDVRALIGFLFSTGARPVEGLRMQWKDVKVEAATGRKTVGLHHRKKGGEWTERRTKIGVSQEKWLPERGAPDDYVFLLEGKPGVDDDARRQRTQAAVDRLKVALTTAGREAGIADKVTAYFARKTRGVNLLRASHGNVATAAALMGNTPAVFVKAYSHILEAELDGVSDLTDSYDEDGEDA